MNITDHIVALLKSGKDVEMNGIGAFVVKTIDAYMDESTKTFYPKRQTVEFHPYTEDRGNIVELIARKECVDESTAQRMWKNYYDALQDKLQSQHSHTFPELGDLNFDNGNYSFSPIEGLNLLGNSEELQPVVGVDTFETNPNEDPFAVFDNPESVVPEPETSDAEPDTPTVDDTPADAEQPANEPEPVVVPAALPETEQPEEKNIDQQPETTSEPEPVEEATKDAEPVPSPAPAVEEKAEQVTENNQVADKPADDLQTILDDEPDAPVETTKTNNRRGTKTLIILLIILLLLLWAGAACYYFFVFKKNTKPVEGDKPTVEQTDNNAAQASQLKSDENTVQPETEVESEPEEITATEPETTPVAEPEQEVAQNESATDANTDNGSLNAVASNYDYNKFNSSFAFDLSNVEITAPDAVATNKNLILKRLSNRIDRYVAGRQYSSASGKLKEKIGQFVEERLGDKFNTQNFNVTDLMPYTTDNFVRQYVGDELQTRKQRRVRYEVIEEIFANNMLGQYLDELINAGEVSKDVVKAPPAPVYTAPVYTNPKAGFDVIAGTYRDKQTAMRMASSLRKKGAGAYVIEKGGLYYVSAGSAPSRTAADRVMYQLKTWYTSNLSIKQW